MVAVSKRKKTDTAGKKKTKLVNNAEAARAALQRERQFIRAVIPGVGRDPCL